MLPNKGQELEGKQYTILTRNRHADLYGDLVRPTIFPPIPRKSQIDRDYETWRACRDYDCYSPKSSPLRKVTQAIHSSIPHYRKHTTCSCEGTCTTTSCACLIEGNDCSISLCGCKGCGGLQSALEIFFGDGPDRLLSHCFQEYLKRKEMEFGVPFDIRVPSLKDHVRCLLMGVPDRSNFYTPPTGEIFEQNEHLKAYKKAWNTFTSKAGKEVANEILFALGFGVRKDGIKSDAFFSFCRGTWVKAEDFWHCKGCGKCMDGGNWHCAPCNMCVQGLKERCPGCEGVSKRFYEK